MLESAKIEDGSLTQLEKKKNYDKNHTISIKSQEKKNSNNKNSLRSVSDFTTFRDDHATTEEAIVPSSRWTWIFLFIER